MPKYRLRGDQLEKVAAAKGDTSGYAIAKRSGLAESTVSRLRRGLARPAAETLVALVTAYETTIDELVSIEPESEAS